MMPKDPVMLLSYVNTNVFGAVLHLFLLITGGA